eukprot:3883053-Prorocentrum_lima.AAC.1
MDFVAQSGSAGAAPAPQLQPTGIPWLDTSQPGSSAPSLALELRLLGVDNIEGDSRAIVQVFWLDEEVGSSD